MKNNLDNSKGAQPLYIQIKEILFQRISNGIYKTGETIPTELDFQEEFDVSRITVRQAINELVVDGYLTRRRGKGTVVIKKKIEEKLNRVLSFTKEMQEMGITPSTSYAQIERVKSTAVLAKKLNIEVGQEVYLITRIRCADGQPIVFFETYLIGDLKLPLDHEVYFGSMYQVIESTNPVKITKAKEYIGAEVATKTLAERLEISKGDPILTRTRVGYDQNERAIEFTTCYYVAKQYQYYVELDRE